MNNCSGVRLLFEEVYLVGLGLRGLRGGTSRVVRGIVGLVLTGSFMELNAPRGFLRQGESTWSQYGQHG